MADETPLVLYTIGHSNLEAEQFLTLLRQHDVTVLVDVWSRPVSKYVPHFNKDVLEAFLTRNGIDYRFAGKYLGGQPEDSRVYKDRKAPDPATEHEKYLRLVDYELVISRDWFHKGISRLLEIICETPGNVAIMCSEGNPRECHRLIARSLIGPFDRITDAVGQVFDLPINDLTFLTYIERLGKNGLPLDYVMDLLLERCQRAETWLRLGLTRPFQGWCWLQVTGVDTFPDYLVGKNFAELE